MPLVFLKLAAVVVPVGLVSAASTNDVVIAVATLFNTSMLVLGAVLTSRNRHHIADVRERVEDTFQSTTHAARAADGAARAAAITTMVATKHLGIDIRQADIDALSEVLERQPPGAEHGRPAADPQP